MEWTLTFSICVVVAVHSLPQGNLDDLVSDVFGTENRNPQSQSNSRPTQDESINAACTQENGQLGQCVLYHLCSANNSIITDGVGLFDIRGKREIRNEEIPCPEYLDVCCGSPDIRDTSILPPTTPYLTPRPGPGTNPVVPGSGGGGNFEGGDGDNEGDGGRNEYDVISGCGQRNPEGVGFRAKADTDNEAAFGEFPWMVAILTKESETSSGQEHNVYICGGSLIHPKVVMTAAHCVSAMSGTRKLKIRAGEWDTQNNQEIFPHQDRNVVQIMSHEQYNNGNLHNDIALLILESPITYAENIGVVCLPPENEEPSLNAKCYATGWGKHVFGKGGKNSIILKRISLAIIPRNKCQADLRKTKLGNKFTLHHTFICADGEKGTDTYKADGGSPLVCPMPGYPGKFMQSGIVAWGISRGKGSTPEVYVHIASLRTWIDDQLFFNNINDMNLYAP